MQVPRGSAAACGGLGLGFKVLGQKGAERADTIQLFCITSCPERGVEFSVDDSFPHARIPSIRALRRRTLECRWVVCLCGRRRRTAAGGWGSRASSFRAAKQRRPESQDTMLV